MGRGRERWTQAFATGVGDPPARRGKRRWTVEGVFEAPLDVAELGAKVGNAQQAGEAVSINRGPGGSLTLDAR